MAQNKLTIYSFSPERGHGYAFTHKGLYEITLSDSPRYGEDGNPKKVTLDILSKALGKRVTQAQLSKVYNNKKISCEIGCSKLTITDNIIVVRNFSIVLIVTPEISKALVKEYCKDFWGNVLEVTSKIKWVKEKLNGRSSSKKV